MDTCSRWISATCRPPRRVITLRTCSAVCLADSRQDRRLPFRQATGDREGLISAVPVTVDGCFALDLATAQLTLRQLLGL